MSFVTGSVGGFETLTRRETIAAVATPWGEGGIGIIRISGERALAVADQVLILANGARLSDMPARTVCYGWIKDGAGARIDEVLAFAFRAPKSYTREDLVEVQAHGGPVVMRRALGAILEAGAALAEPGEFTARAVVNGRLDLVQAEAVLDLIRAKTEEAAEAALRRLADDGGRELRSIEADTMGLLAAVEAWLDFPEDVPPPDPGETMALLGGIMGRLDAILAGAEQGRLLTEGATIVIVGRPNVGKSSLLNALLGEERAIVASLPGTTRDAVAEEFSLGGIPVRLVDTAGLAEAGDEIEILGMERSRREIARSDLVLLVLDGSASLTMADEAAAGEASVKSRGVIAINKGDLPEKLDRLPEATALWPVVRVSARTGQGLTDLRSAMREAISGRQNEGIPVLSHLRQIEAAREARAALARCRSNLASGITWDLLAGDLRTALAALARLTGRELGPDLMREIFARFCIGK